MFVPKDIYYQIIKNTQLVSIDVILRYLDLEANQYKYLLGLRKNKPAQNTWFIPGSRIYKEVLIKDGIKLVCEKEYGTNFNYEPEFVGVYEHIYQDNFVDNLFGTHYIDFAFLITINQEEVENLDLTQLIEQHEDIKWMTREEIVNNNKVHQYTKNYFVDNPLNPIIPQKIRLI